MVFGFFSFRARRVKLTEARSTATLRPACHSVRRSLSFRSVDQGFYRLPGRVDSSVLARIRTQALGDTGAT